jgi:protein-disulfide isomerase
MTDLAESGEDTSNNGASGSEANLGDEVPTPDSIPAGHVLGEPGAPVTVVEYGDYECPYCAAAAPVLHELVQSSEGQVRVVFRNFPLFDTHPHALTAALAAEASAPLGVFWKMHYLLFKHQDRLTDLDLRAYGDKLGIDGSLLIGDPAQQFQSVVQRDYTSGINLGVAGTPTLYVNGAVYTGRIDLNGLQRAIRRCTQRTRVAPWSRR